MGSNHKHVLKLLSYNIQTGVDTQRYRHYVTQSWKHVLPHRERVQNLNRIAAMIHEFDVVGLQEVDSGSLRSGFVDQTEYLAHRAGFPFWHKQINRSLGKLAQQSNGLLCKTRPTLIEEHKLPGLPGRGVIVCNYGGEEGITICSLHLALGRRARMRQVAFLGDMISHLSRVVVMGDLNCGCGSDELKLLTESAHLQEPACDKSTFPSWRPMRTIDHILVSESLQVENGRVLDYPFSDHLPISINIILPEGLDLAA